MISSNGTLVECKGKVSLEKKVDNDPGKNPLKLTILPNHLAIAYGCRFVLDASEDPDLFPQPCGWCTKELETVA